MEAPPETIDYEAIYEQLQRENERLRLRVLKLRYDYGLADMLHIDDIRAWVSDPQNLSLLIMLIAVVIVPLVKAIVSRRRRRKSDEE